jgi:hypothetical protein
MRLNSEMLYDIQHLLGMRPFWGQGWTRDQGEYLIATHSRATSE